MRVAITQNRIQPGGRFHVIIALVKLLNELGIKPDILTFKSRISKSEIINKYGENIDFNLLEIFHDVRLPFELHILFFNFTCRLYLKNYDLTINSNNTSFGLPQKINLISYTHYPRKDRLMSNYVSTHFPDGEKKSWFKPLQFFNNFVSFFYKFNHRLNQNESVLANSEFSALAIKSNYSTSKNKIEVIYPPIKIEPPLNNNQKSNKNVVSVARFAPDKRQLEQIEIAEHLRDFTFHIIGFVKENDNYFENCKKAIEEKNLSNVKLYPNIRFEEMQSILNDAMFFIHNLRNEPFGITTVQAIAKDCIPIVHNSGGQKEIVNNENLRYNSVEEAVQILKEFSAKELDELKQIQKILSENIKKFDESNFINKMKDVLLENMKVKG